MARQDHCLDFQRLLVTEDESLDSHNNIITRLHLEHRLPEGRQACDRLFEELGLQPQLQPAREDQGDRTRKQFVFQGQCLVLGDSGVGKTSLVNSLTGKPFDPKQLKTQGVEYNLVDRKWQNLDLNDLIFGNVSPFFNELLVQLTLFGKAGNVIVQESTNFTNCNPLGRALFTRFAVYSLFLSFFIYPYLYERGNPFSLFVYFFLFIGLILAFCFYWERFRLIVITCVFIVNYRGLLMGAILSVISKDYFSGTSAIRHRQISIIHAFLYIATFVLLVCMVFFLFWKSLRSCIERKCQYPGQLKFKNEKPVEIILIGRFVISVFLGFTFFAVLMAITPNKIKALPETTMSVVFLCYAHLLLQPVPRIFKSLQGWLQRAGFVITIICFLYVGDHFLPLDMHFFMVYLICFCDTVYLEYFCLSSALAIIGNDNEGSNTFTAVCIEKAVIDQKRLRNALDKKFSSLKLKILDFAGDKEYHAYHHMFLRSQAIYVIVFNMAEYAKDSFRDINARIRQLHQWFESVCSHVPPKTPIFLVGTHRGNMNKIWMESLNGYLKKNLWNLYCDEVIENDVDKLIFFPVENSVGQNDVGVKTLQKKLMIVAEEHKETIGRDIPLSWIQIQDEIISLKENKEAKFCVTLEEFPTVFGDFICTNWCEETLKYFHEKGLVIYLDKDPELSRWVLLKPERLVDIIIQLVMPPQQMMQEIGLKRDWKLLQDKGMLTESLLESIISKGHEHEKAMTAFSKGHEHEKAMTAFLEEYDLICPLSNKKAQISSLSDEEEYQPTHFVPSLLPMSADGCIQIWHDNTTDKKFYVFFKRFLPEPLFHRLLSRAHKNSKLEFPNGPTVVFRDVGKFWMTPWQPYRLKLMNNERIIEVTFSLSNRQRMKPADVLCQVFSMVDGICKRDFPFVKFHCGPACPADECPGYQDNYMHTPYQHTRHHVYNVMPGRQGDNIASLYCVNNNFEEELEEWIP